MNELLKCGSSEYFDARFKTDVLQKEFESAKNIRDSLAHTNGSIDVEKDIPNLITAFTFINMLIPNEHCLNEVIQENELKALYVELCRKYNTQKYITNLRELKATTYKEAVYLPSEPLQCENCENASAQILFDSDYLINACALCEYWKYYFSCQRCGNLCDKTHDVAVEMDDDTYLCTWCEDDYMSKN